MAHDSDSDSDSSDSDIEPPFFHLCDEGGVGWVSGHTLFDVDSRPRRPKQRHKQIDFAKHVRLQSNANMFQRHHHMTPKSFKKLVSLPAPHLQVNKQKAANSGGIMPIKHVVAMGL